MGKAVNPHPFMTPEWYRWIHDSLIHPHTRFLRWAQASATHINSILEIGCGKHDYYHQAFVDQIYFGLDVSQDVIDYCNAEHTKTRASGHFWFCGNVMDFHFKGKFDLVFNHAVIDHSDNPDAFLLRCIQLSKRYVYIMSYRGCFPALEEHRIEKGEDKYFYADISMPQIRKLLSERKDVKQFDLVAVPTMRAPEEIQEELHIIIEL